MEEVILLDIDYKYKGKKFSFRAAHCPKCYEQALLIEDAGYPGASGYIFYKCSNKQCGWNEVSG